MRNSRACILPAVLRSLSSSTAPSRDGGMRWIFTERHTRLVGPLRSQPRSTRRLIIEVLEPRTLLATLPPGFTESVAADNLSSATAMELAPNGDLWVLEQGGLVK